MEPHMLVILGEAAGTTPAPIDSQERSLIFIIAACMLGLIVVLLVILQLAAIRRRPKQHTRPQGNDPEGPDPWIESAKRLDSDDEDQS